MRKKFEKYYLELSFILFRCYWREYRDSVMWFNYLLSLSVIVLFVSIISIHKDVDHKIQNRYEIDVVHRCEC